MERIFPSRALPCAARCCGVLALLICFHANSFGQPNRISQTIDSGRRFTMRGNLHPIADSSYDRGRVDPSLKLDRLTLVLKPSDTQAAELGRLLTELHNPRSANYHKWLTPESYADRFGLSQPDIDKIAAWLTAQQLAVTSVARARNAITVSGTVDRIERAFQTEIHTYVADGKRHYANVTEPTLPGSLEGIVLAIHGLHDFRLQPRNRMLQTPVAVRGQLTPNYTSTKDSSTHYLAPDDFASIFNIKPVYNQGIDGSNQNIVIVGQNSCARSCCTPEVSRRRHVPAPPEPMRADSYSRPETTAALAGRCPTPPSW